MAIKVIKHGETKFKIICPVCGCEFEYEYEDLVECYIPGLKQIKCPDCGEWLTHKRAEPVKSLEKDITWKFPKDAEPIPCSPSDPITKPYVTWTSNIPDWPDCETCPNKPDPTKTVVGDTPCTWCRKNQPYCTTTFPTDELYAPDPYLSKKVTYTNALGESPTFETTYTTDAKIK